MVDHNRQFEDPELESELRQALQPRSAPPDFAARVMQHIPIETAAKDQPRRASILHFPAPARLAAVASLLIVILTGTLAYQHHRKVVEGERARRQVFIALQITHSTLQQVAENISTIQNGKELHP